MEYSEERYLPEAARAPASGGGGARLFELEFRRLLEGAGPLRTEVGVVARLYERCEDEATDASPRIRSSEAGESGGVVSWALRGMHGHSSSSHTPLANTQHRLSCHWYQLLNGTDYGSTPAGKSP